ncbi:MAG: class I SAM-dependent methyltransferase [Elusimicrobia bacterium]|nr:class I SAM-dependent methyltransferase [Elusimicrobiota bacterium]
MAFESDVNARYYGALELGRRDYWRWMAAPRARVTAVSSILADAPPDRLCDLGCGDGAFLSKVTQLFPQARMTGIDRSSTQMQLNRKEWPTVSWIVTDLDTEGSLGPELRESFDAVTALEVIEHVSRPDLLLSHAFALARPAGRLILSTQSGPLRETERRVGHRRHFSVSEMTALLNSAGWKPLRVWNTGWPFHDLSKWIANLFPDRAMRRYGEEAYSVQQKIVCACLRGLFKLNSSFRGAQLYALAEKP